METNLDRIFEALANETGFDDTTSAADTDFIFIFVYRVFRMSLMMRVQKIYGGFLMRI